jgi:hypothetical protein
LGTICGTIKKNTLSCWHTYKIIEFANGCDVYVFNCFYLSVNGAVQDFEILFSPLTYPAVAEMEI